MSSTIDSALRDIVRAVLREELPSQLRAAFESARPAATANTPDRLMTADEAAAVAQVNVKTLRKWVRKGLLRGSYSGRLLRIKTTALESFLMRDRKDGGDAELELDEKVASILSTVVRK